MNKKIVCSRCVMDTTAKIFILIVKGYATIALILKKIELQKKIRII